MRIFLEILIISVVFSVSGFAQSTGSFIVIRDVNKESNGGSNATSDFRSEIESALAQEEPCVDTLDEEDINDLIGGARDKEMLDDNGDPNAFLKELGELLGSGYVMGVSATPGPGGSTLYTAFVGDQGKTFARATGTDAKQVAQDIVKQLGSLFPDDCIPHWVGSIEYYYYSSEEKETTDKGTMRASVRNTKRQSTQTMLQVSLIKTIILPPKKGAASARGTVMARVWSRAKSETTKKSETSGEMLCRRPGKNPEWVGFSDMYKEAFAERGAGTDTLPVFIQVDESGNYKITVTTPGMVMLSDGYIGQSVADCNEPKPLPEASPFPNSGEERKTEKGSFSVEGIMNVRNPDRLSGSKTLPDGKTKIQWNLRYVKPKGKK
jgi:hypothetical protein